MTDLVLGGQAYCPVNFDVITAEHDGRIHQVLAQAGLLKDDFSGDDAVFRVTERLLSSNAWLDIVALSVLPLGETEEDWTPELAAEIRLKLGRVTSADERNEMRRLAQEVCWSFFGFAVGYLTHSLSCFRKHLELTAKLAAAT